MPTTLVGADQFVMGYLAEGKHCSYVLFDRSWPEAKTAKRILLFCQHCEHIISLDRSVARAKIRRLDPEETRQIGEQLVNGYRIARDEYETSRFGNAPSGSEKKRARVSGTAQPTAAREDLSTSAASELVKDPVKPRRTSLDVRMDESSRIDYSKATCPASPSSGAGKSNDWLGALREKFRQQVSEIENRTDLSTDDKVSRITHIACSVCAGVAIQPIPFADIFILTPLQGYFGSRIAAIRGVPVSDSEAADLTKEIVGLMGMGFAAQQLALGIWKLVSFGAGGLLTIPLVYGLTYAIMKVIDAYYVHKARGVRLSDEQLKKMLKEAMREGKELAKSAEAGIREKQSP